MKTLGYYILSGLISISGLACTNSNKSTDSVKQAEKTNDSIFKNSENNAFLNDADFAVVAFNQGLTEIAIGNIAQKNGLDQGIKDLGKSAVDDYSAMNEKLKVLAANKNIILPSEPGRKSKKKIDEISERSGNIFDRAYIEMTENERAREIKTFQDAEKKATDADIKTFASETLPMLRRHLAAVEELKPSIPYY